MTLSQISKIELPTKLKPCPGKPTNIWVQQNADITVQNALKCKQYYPSFGCVRLTCANAQAYMTLTGATADFTEPFHPAEPDYSTANSAAAVSKLEAEYELQKAQYEYYQQVDQALLQQYLDTVPEEYYSTLKTGALGYHNVTTRTMLKHLKDNYGQITAEDLNENEERIKTPWDPRTTSIETFWKQHTDGKEYTANCTKGKIDDDRLIVYATANIRATDITAFKDTITDFEAKTPAQQTWAEFQKMINKTYKQLPASYKNPPTTKDLGYKGANALEEKENEPYPHWCWSHGVTWNPEHTSKTCRNKFSGHVDNSNFFNMCGGCNRIGRRNGEKTVWKPKNWKPRQPLNEQTAEGGGPK